MTSPDRQADRNPPCTARTGVGIGVVLTVAVALAALIVTWLLR